MKILIFYFLIISTNACNRIRYASKCYQCDNCDEPFAEYAYNLNRKTCFPNQVCLVSDFSFVNLNFTEFKIIYFY